MDYFDQRGDAVRLEWGWRGAERAAERGDVLVVVDTLSFATVAVAAVERGVRLYPCQSSEEAREVAERTGAEVGGKRGDARYTMSPVSFLDAPSGLSVALPTPNGATCCRLGRSASRLFVGTLRNASAVAQAVSATLDGTGRAVTVLACGERWRDDHPDGPLRFALEDLLGAGAVIASLPTSLARSPEAETAVATFDRFKQDLMITLLNCGSGVELVERGYPEDVDYAAELDASDVAPFLTEAGYLEPWRAS